MTDKVFPDTDDVLTKADLRNAFKFTTNASDYVKSGLTVTAAGTVGTIASGDTFVNGTYISAGASRNVTLVDNSTNYIYIGYHDVDGVQEQIDTSVNQTGTSPGANYILLASVVLVAGVAGTPTDLRVLTAIAGWRDG